MSNQLSSNLRALISRGSTEGEGVVGEISKNIVTDCDYYIKQLVNLPAGLTWSYSTQHMGIDNGVAFDSVIKKEGGIYTDITASPSGNLLVSAGDAVLFGSDEPIEAIVCSIFTGLVSPGTFTLSYSSSLYGTVAWPTASMWFDGTTGFSNTGVRKILFKAPNSWVKTYQRDDGTRISLPNLPTATDALYFVKVERVDSGAGNPLLSFVRRGYTQKFIHVQNTGRNALQAKFNFDSYSSGEYLNFTLLTVRGGLHDGITIYNPLSERTSCYVIIGF